MAVRVVTDAGLRLASGLRGAPLASPARRLTAFAIDAALVFLPSLLVALLAAWAVLAVREPAALRALTDLLTGRLESTEQQRTAMRNLVELLARYHMPGTPAAVAAAVEAGDLDAAVAALGDRNLVIVLNAGEDVVGADSNQVRFELQRLMPPGVRLASFYGVAALYFSWLTSRRTGATLGKRWLGIRVVRLDHGELGLIESFERFVGYAQVPASLFTALLDFWRDPNRRLPHDRLSGTLVIRVR
jgi:uncharacterized RDD family membrane protein YckC